MIPAAGRTRLACLVVKAFTSTAEDPGFDSRLQHGNFSESSHASDLKCGTPVATLQIPGVRGSAAGMVGPVLAYCDWVR